MLVWCSAGSIPTCGLRQQGQDLALHLHCTARRRLDNNMWFGAWYWCAAHPLAVWGRSWCCGTQVLAVERVQQTELEHLALLMLRLRLLALQLVLARQQQQALVQGGAFGVCSGLRDTGPECVFSGQDSGLKKTELPHTCFQQLVQQGAAHVACARRCRQLPGAVWRGSCLACSGLRQASAETYLIPEHRRHCRKPLKAPTSKPLTVKQSHSSQARSLAQAQRLT